MKNLKTTLLLMTLIAGISNVAKACLQDNWIPLSANVVSMQQCLLGEKLSLDRQEMSYSKMHYNPYFVEYWHGSSSRKISVKTTYLHEVIDYCGLHEHVILSEKQSITETQSVSFNVENPNLSDSIQYSYELSPMTDAEAKTALAKTLSDCQNYQPPQMNPGLH